MKIVKSKAATLRSTLVLGSLLTFASALPATAQTPVTVPPATAPVAIAAPVTVATDAAPTVMPAAQMPVAAAPTTLPEPLPATTVVAPIAQPGMPSLMPSAVAVTAPPAGMPTGTPAVVTQVMSNLQDSKNNVSVEDLSKAQDALTRLDLLLQIEKKIGEIKKTQDDRESNGSGGGMAGGMVGQIPASALVLPGQMSGGGMAGGGAPVVSNPIISSAPASSASYEIEQISGTNGNYSAILMTPDGDRKTVRAGDKLDGRRVEAVSFDSVQLGAAGTTKKSKKGGKTLTIHNDTILLTPMAR